MANGSRITLCISLADTDEDVLAWCNAQANLSASFRALVRNNIRHQAIMKKLDSIEIAVKNIKIIESAPKKKTRKPKVDSDILGNIDNLLKE